MDKFEQYLEAQIEACKRQKAGRGAWNYEHGVLLGSQETLEQALIEYRKHKQDVPALKVGDRVRHTEDRPVTKGTIKKIRYVVQWDRQDYLSGNYPSVELEPIEDEIEK